MHVRIVLTISNFHNLKTIIFTFLYLYLFCSLTEIENRTEKYRTYIFKLAAEKFGLSPIPDRWTDIRMDGYL